MKLFFTPSPSGPLGIAQPTFSLPSLALTLAEINTNTIIPIQLSNSPAAATKCKLMFTVLPHLNLSSLAVGTGTFCPYRFSAGCAYTSLERQTQLDHFRTFFNPLTWISGHLRSNFIICGFLLDVMLQSQLMPCDLYKRYVHINTFSILYTHNTVLWCLLLTRNHNKHSKAYYNNYFEHPIILPSPDRFQIILMVPYEEYN